MSNIKLLSVHPPLTEGMARAKQVVLMLIFVTILVSFMWLPSDYCSLLLTKVPYVSRAARRRQKYLSGITSQEQPFVNITVYPLFAKSNQAAVNNSQGLDSTINASSELGPIVKTFVNSPPELHARPTASNKACTNLQQIGGDGALPANGNVGVRYRGRMANNMIQYIHARAQSDLRRQGLVTVPRGDKYAGQDFLADFKLSYRSFSGPTVELQEYCGGEYSQYYLLLMHYRALGKCLFSPIHRRGWAPKRGVVLKPEDVVIHHRNHVADGEPGSERSTVTVSYYVSILARIKYNKIYIIAASALHQSDTIETLKNRFSAEIYHVTPSEDLSLAIMAPTLIGSFGTFSWVAAYLSEGSSIHLPFYSNLESGTDWLPWNHLFMHDDARITYHDVAAAESITHETAAQVLAGETSFGKSVRARKDPCADAGLYKISL